MTWVLTKSLHRMPRVLVVFTLSGMGAAPVSFGVKREAPVKNAEHKPEPQPVVPPPCPPKPPVVSPDSDDPDPDGTPQKIVLPTLPPGGPPKPPTFPKKAHA